VPTIPRCPLALASFWAYQPGTDQVNVLRLFGRHVFVSMFYDDFPDMSGDIGIKNFPTWRAFLADASVEQVLWA
jgi:hypothetical protein